MTEAAILLEQARILRTLAPTFDHPIIRDDVLRLAETSLRLPETSEGLAQALNSSAQKLHNEYLATTAVATCHWAARPGIITEVSEPTHKSLKDLYAYWLSKQGVRIGPPKSAIRLEEVGLLLPNIALADVVGDPPRFRFLVFGKNLTAAYGENIAGKFLDEIDLGSVSLTSDAVNFWTTIVRERRPQVARIRYTKQQDRRYLDYERIGLPLSEDGKAVSMILFAYAFDTEFLNAVS
jgi:hypothetical protein